MDDTDGAPQPEANGNADMDEEESHSNEEEGVPSTVPHATAPQETPNLLDQPRCLHSCLERRTSIDGQVVFKSSMHMSTTFDKRSVTCFASVYRKCHITLYFLSYKF